MSSTRRGSRSKRIPKRSILDESFQYYLPGCGSFRRRPKSEVPKPKTQLVTVRKRREPVASTSKIPIPTPRKVSSTQQSERKMRSPQQSERKVSSSQQSERKASSPRQSQRKEFKAVSKTPGRVEDRKRKINDSPPRSAQGKSKIITSASSFLGESQPTLSKKSLSKLPCSLSDSNYWQPVLLLEKCDSTVSSNIYDPHHDRSLSQNEPEDITDIIPDEDAVVASKTSETAPDIPTGNIKVSSRFKLRKRSHKSDVVLACSPQKAAKTKDTVETLREADSPLTLGTHGSEHSNGTVVSDSGGRKNSNCHEKTPDVRQVQKPEPEHDTEPELEPEQRTTDPPLIHGTIACDLGEGEDGSSDKAPRVVQDANSSAKTSESSFTLLGDDGSNDSNESTHETDEAEGGMPSQDLLDQHVEVNQNGIEEEENSIGSSEGNCDTDESIPSEEGDEPMEKILSDVIGDSGGDNLVVRKGNCDVDVSISDSSDTSSLKSLEPMQFEEPRRGSFGRKNTIWVNTSNDAGDEDDSPDTCHLDVEEDPLSFDVESPKYEIDPTNCDKDEASWSCVNISHLLNQAGDLHDLSSAVAVEIRTLKNTICELRAEVALLKLKLSKYE